ncbi:uncharacterized protein LOC141856971 [Brevipalpus obovatus]|uniref:uncharacterized protein LOC141856971 n=1 Tax=Brevipalpus obovatus TaxID=246614 RepID=UPI003D9E70F4
MAETYVVKKVVGKSVTKDGVFFLIEWEGYPGENSWEPHDNCGECLGSIDDFEQALGIYLKRIRKKIRNGKASNEEAAVYNKTKCENYMIEIDPDDYLKKKSKRKVKTLDQAKELEEVEVIGNRKSKKVVEVLGYKPRLDVFHVKYCDGDEEYLDRAYVNKNCEQQLILYYEKRVICCPEINRQIAKEFPRFLSLKGPNKPSYISDLIVQNKSEELPRVNEKMVDISPSEEIPSTKDDNNDEDDLNFLSTLDFDMLDQNNSQDGICPDDKVIEIVQQLLEDLGPLSPGPMTTPSSESQARGSSLFLPSPCSNEQSSPINTLEISIEGSSTLEAETPPEPDPVERFVIEYSDDEDA